MNMVGAVHMRWCICLLLILFMLQPALAQRTPMPFAERNPDVAAMEKAKQQAATRKRVDEKAYRAALEQIPNRKVDAWSNLRNAPSPAAKD